MKKLATTLALCVLILPGVAALAADSAGDAKALFEQKCSTCHGIDRPTSKKKSAEDWASTVDRMRKTNGCALTDEEAKTIVDYLAKNYGM